MGTAEIFIVFSALMALIALVTIGIDWIGKPLKHRRFIARIYRYDDEKLPTDEFGHTTLDAPPASVRSAPIAYVPPAPVVVAHVPGYAPYPAAQALPPAQAAAAATDTAFRASLPDAGTDLEARPADEPPASTGSAFSSSLSAHAEPLDDQAQRDTGEWQARGLVPSNAGLGPSDDDLGASAPSWEPGSALDVSVQGTKPSLATKAERFWMSTAATIGAETHFDRTEIDRMKSGKAPRRMNPRTSRLESMQLTGLRQASQPDQVRMQWPEESIDPWSAT